MPIKTAPIALKGPAKRIWESAYANAWDGYTPKKHDGTQEVYSTRTAWSAVKAAGYAETDTSWQKTKSYGSRRLQLRFTKARVNAQGQLIWHAQAANDELDPKTGEVLDPTLFDDLAATFSVIRAAFDNGNTPPSYWFGTAQEPILDLAHYSALLSANERTHARLGLIQKLYRDGRYLHAGGVFDDTDLGRLAAQGIMNDQDGVIRCSVGFWPDWGNIIVENDILRFMGGRDLAVLDHLAVTSVPRITSTTIFAEEVTMSNTGVTTMADDAKAILGEGGADAVAALERLAKDGIETRSMVMLSEEGEQEVPAADTAVEDELLQENVPAPDALPNAEFPLDEERQEPVIAPAQVDPVAEATPETLAKSAVPSSKKVASKKKPTDKKADKPDFSEDDEEDEAKKDKDADGEKPKVDAKKKAADAKKKKTPAKKADTELVTDSDVAVVGLEVISGPYGGATSFDGARDHQEAVRESWRLSDGWFVLQGVIDNIFNSPMVDDKHSALTTAMSQYVSFVQSNDTLWSTVIVADDPVAVVAPVENDNVGGVDDIAADPADALAALKSAVATGAVSQEGAVDDAVPAAPVEAAPVVTEDGILGDAPIIDAAAVAATSGAVSGNVAALSVVDSTPQVGAGYRRESSFSGVLQGLAEKGRQVARRSAPPAPVPVTPARVSVAPAQAATMSNATPADELQTMVAEQVASALAPVLEVLAQFQGTAPAAPDVNAEETPRRPVRKSQAPVAPARVTSRAKTFGEALDGLLAQR